MEVDTSFEEARALSASASVTTCSRPSPGTLLYTPTCNASSNVDLPWKPPPQMSVTPLRTPMPPSVPPLGTVSETRSEGGERKRTLEEGEGKRR